MSVYRIILLPILAFGISYILTPLTIPLCKAVGAVDIPDGKRKINTRPIPRLGGLAFFTAALIVLFPLVSESETVAAMLAGGAVLAAGGFADDAFDIPPRLKLFIQAAAALIAISFIGIPEHLSFFGLFEIRLIGLVGFVIVLFRMIFTINAVNFSDGLDGLASGLSVVALISLFVYGMKNSNTVPAVSALILAAAVLGFLPYNKYRARVFMGDSGSQFLGLAISLLSLGNAPGNNYTLETSLFLIIPALDTALSVIRRIVKRKSPFAADKGHIHHILLKIGVSHPFAVKLLVSISALTAALTLVLMY